MEQSPSSLFPVVPGQKYIYELWGLGYETVLASWKPDGPDGEWYSLEFDAANEEFPFECLLEDETIKAWMWLGPWHQNEHGVYAPQRDDKPHVYDQTEYRKGSDFVMLPSSGPIPETFRWFSHDGNFRFTLSKKGSGLLSTPVANHEMAFEFQVRIERRSKAEREFSKYDYKALDDSTCWLVPGIGLVQWELPNGELMFLKQMASPDDADAMEALEKAWEEAKKEVKAGQTQLEAWRKRNKALKGKNKNKLGFRLYAGFLVLLTVLGMLLYPLKFWWIIPAKALYRSNKRKARGKRQKLELNRAFIRHVRMLSEHRYRHEPDSIYCLVGAAEKISYSGRNSLQAAMLHHKALAMNPDNKVFWEVPESENIYDNRSIYYQQRFMMQKLRLYNLEREMLAKAIDLGFKDPKVPTKEWLRLLGKTLFALVFTNFWDWDDIMPAEKHKELMAFQEKDLKKTKELLAQRVKA